MAMIATFAAWLLTSSTVITATADEPNSTRENSQLTVVADLGGASALPYFRALNLLPSHGAPSASLPAPQMPHSASEASMVLPVHSKRLTPGPVPHRLIRAPGLTPFFLAGDDLRSRAWIKGHLAQLKQLGALGFIVNVGSAAALTSLRDLAPELTLVPVSADDLAIRLHLAHYPALVTATGIEQ